MCKKNDCLGSVEDLQPLSRITLNILDTLKIRCKKCYDIVSYSSYESHLMKHFRCTFCKEHLPTEEDIRLHYYEKCPKYPIECINCEFIFKRENYVYHDCMEFYRLRLIEMLLFAASTILQAITLS